MEVIGFDGGFTVRETTMDVRITVETIFENGTPKTHHPGHLSRPYGQAQPGEIGLLLEDVRTLLAQLQTAILLDQIKEISAASRICPDCTKIRAIHDYRPRVLDTLFGRFHGVTPRIRRCACNAKSEAIAGGPLSPLTDLFPHRSAPELQRLQAKLRARHSFREAARIPETFLPCARQMNTTLRNRLGKIAHDVSDCDEAVPAFDQDATSPPLTVFLDGAHIRCRPEYQRRHLDVVVGKIESPNMCRRFGLVPQATVSAATQLRQDLHALGWDGKRSVTVISGGEPALPNLVLSAVGQPIRHILDWWHISMRVQHVENAVKCLLQAENFPGLPELFKRPAESLRW